MPQARVSAEIAYLALSKPKMALYHVILAKVAKYNQKQARHFV
jgi:hypothetical protein